MIYIILVVACFVCFVVGCFCGYWTATDYAAKHIANWIEKGKLNLYGEIYRITKEK